MKSALDSNTEIREEQNVYNIIAAPGYEELTANMVSLNNDRRNTAFVVADTPFRLAPSATEISNYNNNTGTWLGEGATTTDPYVGLYYPSAQSTDLTGSTIVVPPSHMALRTMIRSDDVSFPWFAPAGTKRGLVDNATQLGYVNAATGEFVLAGLTEGVRDSLYENKINPITFLPGIGLTVYGQKTRDPNAPSSLDRINVARLVVYMRTNLNTLAKPFVFEPNDKLTRDEIKQLVEQLCNDLVAKRALNDYVVVCDETNNTPVRIDRNELYVDVAIEPVKAAEFIFVPIRLKNTGEIAGTSV
jgi:phage tail sheath protein FI